MGPTWGPPGSCPPSRSPCWPHEPCYWGSITKLLIRYQPNVSREIPIAAPSQFYWQYGLIMFVLGVKSIAIFMDKRTPFTWNRLSMSIPLGRFSLAFKGQFAGDQRGFKMGVDEISLMRGNCLGRGEINAEVISNFDSVFFEHMLLLRPWTVLVTLLLVN